MLSRAQGDKTRVFEVLQIISDNFSAGLRHPGTLLSRPSSPGLVPRALSSPAPTAWSWSGHLISLDISAASLVPSKPLQSTSFPKATMRLSLDSPSPLPAPSSVRGQGKNTQAAKLQTLALCWGSCVRSSGRWAGVLCFALLCFATPAVGCLGPSDGAFRLPSFTLCVPVAFLWTAREPEQADSGPGRAGPGRGLGAGGAARPRPLTPPLAAIARVDPPRGALAAPLREGPELAAAGDWTQHLQAARRVGLGGRGPGPRPLSALTLAPGPSQPRGRALTLPLGAWPRGAMDAALLHSLLEANCSLALAEELLSDGWALALDPEGRQETRRPGRRRLLPWRAGCAQGPRFRALGALRPAASRAPCTPSESRSSLSRRQVPTPTAT